MRPHGPELPKGVVNLGRVDQLSHARAPCGHPLALPGTELSFGAEQNGGKLEESSGFGHPLCTPHPVLPWERMGGVQEG